MATPADQRLLDLLDKWLTSLELHGRYAALDDAAYLSVQPWPAHQRPSRWIIDLAAQKARDLQRHVRERSASADAGFAESLELMMFLANLLAAEHIERYIPLANPATERAADAPAHPATPPPAEPAASGVPHARDDAAASEPRQAAPPAPEPHPAAGIASEAMYELVIEDAARLVQWGRKWYELAELISSMADRPSLIDVRRILKDNKTVIDKRAGRG